MNQKLFQFAVEQLYRDPQMRNQETQTAVLKYFGSRDNVDELLELVRSLSFQEMSNFRQKSSQIIMDMAKNESKMRARIFELEHQLSLANTMLKFNNNSKYRHYETDDNDLNDNSNFGFANRQQKSADTAQAFQSESHWQKKKKVRVWTAGRTER